VVVIKDKDQVALERFIFSVQNMIAVESYNKDTRFAKFVFSIHLS
jgi:mitotic spindle assembly checkpoint protein MAD2B